VLLCRVLLLLVLRDGELLLLLLLLDVLPVGQVSLCTAAAGWLVAKATSVLLIA